MPPAGRAPAAQVGYASRMPQPAAAHAKEAAASAAPDQRALIAALIAAVFIVSLDARVVAPLLPTIAAELHAPLDDVGLLVTAYMLPYGFFQLAFGPLSERYGKIRVSAYAMVLFSVGTAFCGAFASLGLVILLRALTGAAAAALIPLTLAYIGDTVPYAQRQATIGVVMASAGAAQAFSTSAGGLIASVVSWRTVFPVFGVAAGASTIALLALKGREIRARDGGARPTYGDALRAPRMPALLALVAIEGFLYMGGFSFLSAPLDERFHLGALAIGLIFGLAGVGQLVCARLLPWILKRLSEEALVLGGGGLMGGSFIAAAFAPAWGWIAVATLAMGVGFNLCHTTLQTRATEIFPRSRGTAVALFAFALFAGSGAGALAFAHAIPRVGSTVTFAVAGALLLAFSVVTVMLLGRANGASPKARAPG